MHAFLYTNISCGKALKQKVKIVLAGNTQNPLTTPRISTRVAKLKSKTLLKTKIKHYNVTFLLHDNVSIIMLEVFRNAAALKKRLTMILQPYYNTKT